MLHASQVAWSYARSPTHFLPAHPPQCRLNSLPLTLADVSSATQIDVHTLGRHYLGLVRLLELQPPLLLPADLLPRAVDRVTQQAAASGALSSAHVAALRRDAATLLGWMSRQLERRQLPLASVGAALVLAGEMSAVALSLGHVCTSLQLSRTTLDRKLAQVRAAGCGQTLAGPLGMLPLFPSSTARQPAGEAALVAEPPINSAAPPSLSPSLPFLAGESPAGRAVRAAALRRQRGRTQRGHARPHHHAAHNAAGMRCA